ncbi:MAG: class I SAM-dependent methyltransferase [Flavobacteriales bacterium]|nr:class I SAM-dependent methyltransferase [Flavobacteriales bacterium]
MNEQIKDQEKFYSVYRGRQGALYHLAYMRTAKVKAVQHMLGLNGISLRGIRILDYGFGTGTLFRACHPSCSIAGVEVDRENVEAVRAMLTARKFNVDDIQQMDVAHWKEHPLLAADRVYDVIVLSHVLEHLDDPVEVLTRLGRNLAITGMIVVLLPLNEKRPDPNHKWVCDAELVERWARSSGLVVADLKEMDHFVQPVQPLLHGESGLRRVVAQGVSLGLGLLQAPFSPATWFRIGGFMKYLGAKPGQLGAVLRKG